MPSLRASTAPFKQGDKVKVRRTGIHLESQFEATVDADPQSTNGEVHLRHTSGELVKSRAVDQSSGERIIVRINETLPPGWYQEEIDAWVDRHLTNADTSRFGTVAWGLVPSHAKSRGSSTAVQYAEASSKGVEFPVLLLDPRTVSNGLQKEMLTETQRKPGVKCVLTMVLDGTLTTKVIDPNELALTAAPSGGDEANAQRARALSNITRGLFDKARREATQASNRRRGGRAAQPGPVTIKSDEPRAAAATAAAAAETRDLTRQVARHPRTPAVPPPPAPVDPDPHAVVVKVERDPAVVNERAREATEATAARLLAHHASNPAAETSSLALVRALAELADRRDAAAARSVSEQLSATLGTAGEQAPRELRLLDQTYAHDALPRVAAGGAPASVPPGGGGRSLSEFETKAVRLRLNDGVAKERGRPYAIEVSPNAHVEVRVQYASLSHWITDRRCKETKRDQRTGADHPRRPSARRPIRRVRTARQRGAAA